MLARIGGEETIKVLTSAWLGWWTWRQGADDRTMVVGTAGMAPEQIDGRASAIGPATDVYAGATAYQLAVGRRRSAHATSQASSAGRWR